MSSFGPLVSVVIPTWNAAAYIATAVESALAQTHAPIEVLVVDDGSTDQTASVLARFGERIRILSQLHAGAGPARNLGVKEAKGEFLAFLDADDRWSPTKTTSQLQLLSSRPDLDIVYGHAQEFVSEELSEPVKSRIFVHPGATPAMIAGTVLLRRATFERIGGFESSYRVAEFVDWYLRARDLGLRVELLPETVLYRRLHTANLGVRERSSRADYARALKMSLDRRRAQDKANLR